MDMASAGSGPGSLRRTEAVFERVMRAGVAGAVAAVSRGPGDLMAIAGGRAAPDRPMTTSTVVPWSCAGKPLLAVACLRLAAAGVLDLDSVVTQWRPEFGLLHPRLTLRHLLTHTAAVDEKGSAPGTVDRELHEWPPEPGRGPGRHHVYSAWWNWGVLAAVIETVSGTSADAVITQTVLHRARMRDCSIISAGPGGGNDDPAGPGTVRDDNIMLLTPDSRQPGDWLEPSRLRLEHHDPSTRMCGPVTELVRFYRWVQSSWESTAGPLPASLARMATTMQLPLGCENEDWRTGPGLGFCVGMKALGLGKHCSRLSFGYAGALGGGNLVVGLAEPQHDIVIAAAVGCLGRRAAFALKAVVTALYEDVLTVI